MSALLPPVMFHLSGHPPLRLRSAESGILDSDLAPVPCSLPSLQRSELRDPLLLLVLIPIVFIEMCDVGFACFDRVDLIWIWPVLSVISLVSPSNLG